MRIAGNEEDSVTQNCNTAIHFAALYYFVVIFPVGRPLRASSACTSLLLVTYMMPS